MIISEFKKDNIHIFNLQGKLDAATVPDFRKKFRTAAENGARFFLIDCSGLEYISSAGLRVLFSAAFKLEDLEGKIVCCSVGAGVQRVFDMVDLSSEIQVVSTEEEALRILRA